MINKKDQKTIVFTVRIPIEWYRKIEKIAEEECRTKNSIAKQAIKDFLKKYKS